MIGAHHAPCDAAVAHGLRVDEAVERRLDPVAHDTLVVRPERNRVGLEACLVVMLEAAGDGIGHDVVAQIRGHVGEADLAMAVAFAAPERLRPRKAFRVEPRNKQRFRL